jgi:ATP-dependent Clp protease, protease subunit
MAKFTIGYNRINQSDKAIQTEVSVDGNTIDIQDVIVSFNVEGLEDLGLTSSKDVINEMNDMDGDVLFRISSVGGSIEAGLNIVSRIRDYNKGKTTARVEGYAFSTAGWIPQACDEREIVEGGLFMCHNPILTQSVNSLDDIKSLEGAFVAHKNSIVSTFHNRTGISKDALSKMMDEETYLDAENAVEKGFFDRVFEGDATLAALNCGWGNIPSEYRERINKSIHTSNPHKELRPIEELLAERKNIRNLGEIVDTP